MLRTRPFLPLLLLAVSALARPAAEVTAQAPADRPARIVALGGSVTETIFGLGAGDRVVGVDESSIYPPEVTRLPQVGYYRTLSAEGVLSLAPTMILASSEAGPPAVLEQLRASGVRIVIVPESYSPTVVAEKVRIVAEALGLERVGLELISSLEARLREAEAMRARARTSPRALFVWARGTGGPTVAGSDTGADVVLRLAGARNAAAGIRGYQPMNAEAVLISAPDVLVVPQATIDGLGGLNAVLSLPGIAGTPAGRARWIIGVDLVGLIGFGPRLGDALVELTAGLHPDLEPTAP